MEDTEIDNLVVAVQALEIKSECRKRYFEVLTNLAEPAELLSEAEILKQIMPGLVSLSELKAARKEVKAWLNEGIQIIALGTPLYPELLTTIQDPPTALFLYGEISALTNDIGVLAAVGSRRADQCVCRYAFSVAEAAAKMGLTVVSGLAYGVDAQAHNGALNSGAGAATVAVLGSGLKHIYPSIHRPLAKKIVENGGAVISQFRPESFPLPVNFLNRNRVIAGLADAVLVIQAGEKSGSLSTARYALEAGRDVLVCPGSYSDPNFAGSNHLIKQGAYLFSGVDDLKDFFPQIEFSDFNAQPKENVFNKSDELEREVMRLLINNSMEREELIDILSHSSGNNSNIRLKLLELELSEKIICLPGDMIAKAP